MAEGVLFNIAEAIIGRLGSRLFQEIGLLWGVKDELQKLEKKVTQLQAVLLDAEQKQANHEVKLWLQSVEEAVYEVDDVLDEFHTEAQWRQMVPGDSNLIKQVRNFFSSSNQLAFRLKMGHRIKNLNERLNVIASNRTFHLDSITSEDYAQFVARERVNHSFVPEENIIGRDEDKRAIVRLLLDPISKENVATISIIGLGGLGKTTLAQLVFNDKVVQNHFELTLWVCVSNFFELDILVEKIIQSATNEEPKKRSMDQMQKKLRENINGKRYLLVLDDVWNEDHEKWNSLKCLLMGGAQGSRVLISTRSEIVSTASDTAKAYTLRGLDEEQSWSLFKKMAFEDGNEPENSTIKEAAKDIARKCWGVPLAIRTIGGMLRTTREETEWLTFKNGNISEIRQEDNSILPTLRLSYDVLPSNLKHCFAYCSLFPPDYEIPVMKLIKLWMAQGFIKSSNKNACLEDVGYKYYKQLLWRSFFQEEKEDGLGMARTCKMHDLMNELAISVAGNESTTIDLNDQKNFDEKLRHLSLNFVVDLSKWKMPIPLLKANKMRTFLLLKRYQGRLKYGSNSFLVSFCDTIASNFKSLRMLSLNNLGIVMLPKCLRKMKHLRYLDLSLNPIKKLPNWIIRLQNLETLDLSGCWYLVELPRDIGKLINLRHLILEGCRELAQMPLGLGELTGLRTLGTFALLSESNSTWRYSSNAAGLAELGRLKELRGELVIKNLRHGKDVEAAVLKEKHLSSLTLKWTRMEEVNEIEENDVIISMEDVNMIEENDVIISMEALQPHSNLKELCVRNYGGVRLASWLPSLMNIVNLTLSHCNRCRHLPPLDHFPSLKTLFLEGLENLEYLSDKEWCSSMSGDEMIMSASSSTPTSTISTPFFPSLKELFIRFCPNLKGWWRVQGSDSSAVPAAVGSSSTSTSTADIELPSFPFLSKLDIHGCPKLTSMPLYPNVEDLRLWYTSWKVLSFSSSLLSKLKLLQIHQMEYVPEEIGNLTWLEHLEIEGIPNLESLPESIGNLESLQTLSIERCSNLASLPEGIRRLTSLNRLVIWYCPLLRQRCEKETGQDWYKIKHVPIIYIQPDSDDRLSTPDSPPKIWSSLKTLMRCG